MVKVGVIFVSDDLALLMIPRLVICYSYVSVLPDSVAIQQQLLLTDLEKTVGELNDVLAYIKTQRQEAKDELERLESCS